MCSSDLSSFHVVPRRGSAGGIVPCGATAFFTVMVPSAANVHSVSCVKPADLEPVTSTTAITFTQLAFSGKSTFSGRAW